jgi:hypothetical protein
MFEKYLTPTSLLIPICVLAIGLLPLPTPYYMLVKWVVFIFSGMAFLSLPRVMQKERIATLVLAIIYNPIFPIYFGTRLIWWPINAVALYIFWKFRNDVNEYEPSLNQVQNLPTDNTQTKPVKSSCPYCAEDIRPSANKCKHCGEWL